MQAKAVEAMTEQEILALAAAEARKTTLSWDAWLRRMNGGTIPSTVKVSHWYKAGAALEGLKHLPPVPPPPPPPPPPGPVPSLDKGRNVIFTAWRPSAGLHNNKYKLAITADIHVTSSPDDNEATRAQKANDFIASAKAAAQTARAQGQKVVVWGNQSQIGVSSIRGFAVTLGTEDIIWQAETQYELKDIGIDLDGSILSGHPITDDAQVVVIGNSNSWTQEQRNAVTTLCNAGRFIFIFETYTNQGDPWPDQSTSSGVPVASVSPGVGWGPYPHQLPEYKLHTSAAQWPYISPYLAEDFDATSWAVLP